MVGALVVTALAAGCGGQAAPAVQASAPAPVVETEPSTPTAAAPSPAATPRATRTAPPTATAAPVKAGAGVDPQAFAAGFAAVQGRLSGPGGVALVSPGGALLIAGDATSGVAWSTAKVPVAIAALRAGSTGATTASVNAAIRDSDNAAAERLWTGLGGGARAAAAVEAVLRDGGDAATRVPSTQLRPPYTVFGQTTWTLPRAAGFAARLPCVAGSAPVLADMRHVSGSQQWGFWRVPGAAVKGGWGPGPGGGYLVRQLAVVPTANGQVGVAALVQASSFEAGQRDLDAIAAWAAPFAAKMGGSCG